MSETFYYRKRDKKLGSIQLIQEHGEWVIHSPSLFTDDDADSTLEGLLHAVMEKVPSTDKCIMILLDRQEEDLRRKTKAAASRLYGFAQTQTKFLYMRDLANIPKQAWEEETQSFTFQTLESLGMKAFTEMLRRVQSDSLDAYAQEMLTDPERALSDLRCPEQDIPNSWMIAFERQDPLGMLLPGRLGEDGTLLFIGVAPDFRGRDLGRILHRRGLLTLREHGIRRYLGSATDKNKPMLRVFEKNGCERDCAQIFLQRPSAAQT